MPRPVRPDHGCHAWGLVRPAGQKPLALHLRLYRGRRLTQPLFVYRRPQDSLTRTSGRSTFCSYRKSRHWAWRDASAGKCLCAASKAIVRARGPSDDASIESSSTSKLWSAPADRTSHCPASSRDSCVQPVEVDRLRSCSNRRPIGMSAADDRWPRWER
jgi:hypothetical protein